jgi:uncharacterized protein YbjT (DUF2867 family)
MRIAVTGASGQIGSQVVRLLAGEQAHQVVALSRRALPSGRWPAGVSARAADDVFIAELDAVLDHPGGRREPVSLVQIFRIRDGRIAMLRDYFTP